MRFLPIVERELRVAARRRSAFWVRILAAAIAVGTGAAQLWVGIEWGASQNIGRELFEGLSLLAFGFCLAAGPVFTADVLSEEKRDGTLGLLFLTDLRSPDVVLGKLAAAAVPGVFALLAVVPVVALSLLLGGVTLAEFGRMMIALANGLWFSLAIGMAMSAMCLEARSAFALTSFLLFLTALVAPWWVEQIGGAGPIHPVWRWLASVSPSTGLLGAPASAYATNAGRFWWAAVGTATTTVVLLVVASGFAGRAWREATAFRLSERWHRRWLDLLLGRSAQRRSLRRLLDRNPVLWLASRQRLKRSLLWGLIGAALLAWLTSRWLVSRYWWSVGTTALVAFFLQATLKWLAASEAALRFAEDRRSGALELLLTTGLDVPAVLAGQMQAMRRLFGAPVLALLAVETGMLIAEGPLLARDASWLLVAISMGLFVWDMPTLAWTAMWYSVSGRRPQWASLRAIFRVLVVPWLMFFGALFVVGVWSWIEVGVLWLAICGASNHLARTAAQQRLLSEFRAAAAGVSRAATPPPPACPPAPTRFAQSAS
jgi:hypothetical protein